eukprot:TRINITY_DN8881_c0_g1_i1.p1 TRINITY_DN8881_c0_g1~~TRINITY_DN8881_c0_g1_i1.p1  ORF type:complete len:340 (+),score=121.50 TRINITY_DN8881_c0_g1_i1:91-1110(+)
MVSPTMARAAEARAKLEAAKAKLEELDVLRAKESELKSEVARQTARIAELEEVRRAEKESNAFFGKEDIEDWASADTGVGLQVEAKDPESRRKARLKALNKKLTQIQKLKEKGDPSSLDAEARAKLASEPILREERTALEKGEAFYPPKESNVKPLEGQNIHEVGETIDLPTDIVQVEKRMKGLRKKLQQIADLKSKGGALDADAKAKVASEQRFMQEVAALERGDSSFAFVDDLAEAYLVEKVQLEKKLKQVRKKLHQIDALKEKTQDELDGDAKSKLATETDLQKEAKNLQEMLGSVNKKERERVAQRLGWEEEIQADKVQEKKQQKVKAKAKSVTR